jgi:hypothetical protein
VEIRLSRKWKGKRSAYKSITINSTTNKLSLSKKELHMRDNPIIYVRYSMLSFLLTGFTQFSVLCLVYLLLIDNQSRVAGGELSSLHEIFSCFIVFLKCFVGKSSPEEGKSIFRLLFDYGIEIFQCTVVVLQQNMAFGSLMEVFWDGIKFNSL